MNEFKETVENCAAAKSGRGFAVLVFCADLALPLAGLASHLGWQS